MLLLSSCSALLCVEHGQVVVRLGQFRVILGQLEEGADGVVGFARLRQDDAFQKAHLRVAWLARQVLIGLAQGFGQFAGAHQQVDIAIFVGMRERRAQHCGQGSKTKGLAQHM